MACSVFFLSLWADGKIIDPRCPRRTGKVGTQTPICQALSSTHLETTTELELRRSRTRISLEKLSFCSLSTPWACLSHKGEEEGYLTPHFEIQLGESRRPLKALLSDSAKTSTVLLMSRLQRKWQHWKKLHLTQARMEERLSSNLHHIWSRGSQTGVIFKETLLSRGWHRVLWSRRPHAPGLRFCALEWPATSHITGLVIIGDSHWRSFLETHKMNPKRKI